MAEPRVTIDVIGDEVEELDLTDVVRQVIRDELLQVDSVSVEGVAKRAEIARRDAQARSEAEAALAEAETRRGLAIAVIKALDVLRPPQRQVLSDEDAARVARETVRRGRVVPRKRPEPKPEPTPIERLRKMAGVRDPEPAKRTSLSDLRKRAGA